MGWHTPQVCNESCCDDSPCELPNVSCSANRPYGDTPYFHYEVSNADTAYITEECPEAGTWTSIPIVLSSGAATGDYTMVDGCNYCVVAVNECGTVECCDDCHMPTCSLTFGWDIGSEVIDFYWEYDYGGDDFTDPVISADLHGTSVFGDQWTDSGMLSIDRLTLHAPGEVELLIINDCGQEALCTVPIYCCWDKTTLVVEIADLAEMSLTCSKSGISYDAGGITITDWSGSCVTSGLADVNGTYVFDTVPGFLGLCGAEGEFYIGSVTVTFRCDWSGTWTLGGPPAAASGYQEITYTGDLYVVLQTGTSSNVRILMRPSTGDPTATYHEYISAYGTFQNTYSEQANDIEFGYVTTEYCPSFDIPTGDTTTMFHEFPWGDDVGSIPGFAEICPEAINFFNTSYFTATSELS